MKRRNKIIISEGNRPFWHSLVASVLYTVALILLAMFFFGYDVVPGRQGYSQWDFNAFIIAIPCAVQGIVFSSVKRALFDLDVKRYKEQYCIGPIKMGSWKKLPSIDYVSVFKQPKKDGNFVYETNLWYGGNKHFNIYVSNIPEPAFAMGKSVAKVLEIDLLDATRPSGQAWVNLDEPLDEQ